MTETLITSMCRSLQLLPKPPQNLTVFDITKNSAIIEWLGANGDILLNDIVIAESVASPYIIENLESNTEYTVKVVNRGGESEEVTFTTTGIILEKSGDSISVKGKLNEKDIAINANLSSSKNDTFSFSNTTVDNEIVHETADDITPMRLWTTIGANHGYTSANTITLSGHGKTTADLGSTWTDGTTEYILLAVSSNTLTFAKMYNMNANGTIYSSNISYLADLTHVEGATNTADISIARNANVQLYPSVNNRSISIAVDKTEITADGEYTADSVMITESYQIMDYKAIIDWVKSHIGESYVNDDVDGAVKLTISYEFTNGCACVVSTKTEMLSKQSIQNTGFVQSAALKGETVRYVPDSANALYDWANGVSLSTVTTNQTLTVAQLSDSTFPVNRSIDVSSNVGYALGYVFDKVDGTPEKRLQNTRRFYDLRNTKKVYPIALDADNTSVAEVGTTFEVAGYRVYFDVEENEQRFVYSFISGNEKYLFVDSKTDEAQEVTVAKESDLSELRMINCEVVNQTSDEITLRFSARGYGIFKSVKT